MKNTSSLSALALWMCFGQAAALREPQICYILDGILFFYGIVLTVLYCRIRYTNHQVAMGETSRPVSKKQKAEESIYTCSISMTGNLYGVLKALAWQYNAAKGLQAPVSDTYETIGQKKGMDI